MLSYGEDLESLA